MGIQINGSNDTISAADGGLSISGQSIDNANLNLSQNLNVTGVATVGTLNATQSNPTNINVSGVSTVTNLRATNINLSGITTGLNVSGVTTSSSVIVGSAVTISATGINAPGIGITIASINDGPISGARNRIINGDMRIDQRNAGASVTPTDNQYSVDRWSCGQNVASKFSVQQNAGSVTPPPGFSNYLGCTSLSAYTPTGSNYFYVAQAIEGFNISDFAWGTANARAITLSFWVRSSLTGTFGGALSNGSRAYPYTYTISAANTWEYKTITFAGDTSGTWNATNGYGVAVRFSLGTGSTYAGTAGSWQSAELVTATGATSVVGTNGATFYITGVQLEPGTVATPFERRSYGAELALCQRYYEVGRNDLCVGGGTQGTLTDVKVASSFATSKRAAPTVTATSTGAPIVVASANGFVNHILVTYSAGNNNNFAANWTASTEL